MENLIDDTLTGVTKAEYVEVEPNVHLHITDAGEGQPIVLIHGWPLSDEMFEYQYNDLVNKDFRAIGITLRGFGKSDKPYGSSSYDTHTSDINKVLNKLDIKDAVLVGFSMGGAMPSAICRYIKKLIFLNWFYAGQLHPSGHNVMIFHTISRKMR